MWITNQLLTVLFFIKNNLIVIPDLLYGFPKYPLVQIETVAHEIWFYTPYFSNYPQGQYFLRNTKFDKTLNISQIRILTFLGGVIVREPAGSSGIADTACFFAIPHQVREQACPHAWHGATEKRSASAIPKAPSASLLPSASADGLKGFRGKASSFVGFSPFYGLYLKGLKPTEEPAKPGQSTIRLLKQTAKERMMELWGCRYW